MQPVLCMIMDRRRFGERWGDALVERARAAAEAGVHLIQVRERGLETRELVRLVMRCVDAVAGTSARILVSDRVDVALAAGAHGVHLPAAGAPPARLRPAMPAGFLIGRSVHDLNEGVRVALDGGVDYLLFGTVFPTSSKPGRVAAGLDQLAAMVGAVPLPVLAVGGVTSDRASRIAATGAAGLAAIEMFAAGDLDLLRVRVYQASVAFDTLGRNSP